MCVHRIREPVCICQHPICQQTSSPHPFTSLSPCLPPPQASHPPEEEPPAKRSRRSSVGGTEEQQQQASRPTSNNNNRTAFFDLTEPENATAGPDKQHEKQQEAKQEQAQQQHPVAEVPASEGQAQLQHQAGSERGTGEGTGVSGVTGEEQRQQVSGFGCSNASAEQGPSDQDAAASETKGATQNRPQLLADVQQQIQDIRAALRQELLLPCSLQPSEPGTESTETQQDCTTGEPLPLHEVGCAHVQCFRLFSLIRDLLSLSCRALTLRQTGKSVLSKHAIRKRVACALSHTICAHTAHYTGGCLC